MLQTVINARMLFIGGRGVKVWDSKCFMQWSHQKSSTMHAVIASVV